MGAYVAGIFLGLVFGGIIGAGAGFEFMTRPHVEGWGVSDPEELLDLREVVPRCGASYLLKTSAGHWRVREDDADAWRALLGETRSIGYDIVHCKHHGYNETMLVAVHAYEGVPS